MSDVFLQLLEVLLCNKRILQRLRAFTQVDELLQAIIDRRDFITRHVQVADQKVLEFLQKQLLKLFHRVSLTDRLHQALKPRNVELHKLMDCACNQTHHSLITVLCRTGQLFRVVDAVLQLFDVELHHRPQQLALSGDVLQLLQHSLQLVQFSPKTLHLKQ